MKKLNSRTCALLGGAVLLSQVAALAALAGQPIQLRLGEARRIMLNDGRSILVSCSRQGGRQTSELIPLAAGRSIQLTQYRDRGPTLISCQTIKHPPIPQPPYPPTPLPPLPSGRGTEVVVFSGSDNCVGTVSGFANLTAGHDVTDQCRSQLQNPGASAWSIRVNGSCLNIADTNALSACAQTSVPQHSDDLQITVFSNSDSCSGSVSGSGILRNNRSQAEQCQAMASRGNGSAWSIRMGNSCLNIADTDVISACMGLNLPNSRPTGTTEAVIYSSSDSCSGTVSGSASLIPDYDLQDQCSNLTRLGSSTSAWSVKANGACLNISDTDVTSACLNVRVPSYRGARQVVIFSGSDNCSGSVSAAGYIDPRFSTLAQCQGLKQNGSRSSAWSVRIDDRCVNVQDTDFVSACIGAGI